MPPQVLLLTGHARSGTTMLAKLCSYHPDIQLTFEFHNFANLDTTYRFYNNKLRKNWLVRRINQKSPNDRNWQKKLYSVQFLMRYQWNLLPHRIQQKPVTYDDVRRILTKFYPNMKYVGDKYPRYIKQLDELVTYPDAKIVVIYRDCRDVVASVKKKTQTDWKDKPFLRELYDTTENIVISWVDAIETMERNAEHIHIIRYEDLVTSPADVVKKLADYLDIDVQGFNSSFIRTSSVGKHEKSLNDEDMAVVMELAGSTMQRLNYL